MKTGEKVHQRAENRRTGTTERFEKNTTIN